MLLSGNSKMIICEMAGCHDIATHTADFWHVPESLEICESCAGYWMENQDEEPKIKKLNERENAK
jgi:hypothetical protein